MKADIQKSRAAALLLALCLIAVFSLSALFVVSHADPDCTGTACVGPAFLYLDCTENSSEQLKRPPSKGKVCPFLNGRFCLAFLRPKTGKYADLEVTIA